MRRCQIRANRLVRNLFNSWTRAPSTIIKDEMVRDPYRACLKCRAEIDVDHGEWVADFPGRLTHGYRRDDPGNCETEHLVHLVVCQDFVELDQLMERFKVERCVIDGLPETHATRDFARRHRGDSS